MGRLNHQPQSTIFTVGHSNHPLTTFLDLLSAQRIEMLADVRSSPYSRYTAYFGKDGLQQALAGAGIKYLFLGQQLGGRPEGEQFYDAAGYVLYDCLAQSPAFLAGLERLLENAGQYRTALLCSEEDPLSCHRRLLVGRVLGRRGVDVWHIRGDGSLETEGQVTDREWAAAGDADQLTLFDVEEKPAWKSIRSVLVKKRPGSSSTS